MLATSASVVPHASAKPALSADEGWLIASGRFGFDFTLKRGASGRLSRCLRYRSITARCFGVDVASAPSAEPCASLRLRTSVFRLIGSVIRKVPYRASRLGYVAEQNGWMAQLSDVLLAWWMTGGAITSRID
jgi:hypothetical protein